MKTPERFNRALKVLVQAFFNDTLAKGNCNKCAVGNICNGNLEWQEVFVTRFGVQEINPKNYCGDAKYTIDITGYTWQNLSKVEKAFEENTAIDTWRGYYDNNISKQEIMEDQYRGLMAVVEVLCEIEGLDCTPYKEAFAYNSELQPINNL